MNIENLTKAYQSAKSLTHEVREAHTDAVNSDNQFAEIVLFDLIEETVKLEQKLKRLAVSNPNANVQQPFPKGRWS